MTQPEARERIWTYHQRSQQPPLGYWAIEVRQTVLAHGLASGLPEVMALTHLDNHPSQRVMRRIGMEPLGVMERWYDGPSLVFRARAPSTGDPRDP